MRAGQSDAAPSPGPAKPQRPPAIPLDVPKSALFRHAFWPFALATLRTDLENILVRGLASTAELARQEPLILAPTHVAYWDALVALLLEQKLQVDLYAMMEAEQVKALPFFRWLGALPVEVRGGSGVLASTRRCLQVLCQPGCALCVFPQGQQRPPQLRPLALHAGVHLLASRSGAPVVPVSLNYLFGETSRPTAYVDLRPPIRVTGARQGFMSALEESLCEGLTDIDQCHIADGGLGDFEPCWRRRVRRDGLATRALAGAAARLQQWQADR